MTEKEEDPIVKIGGAIIGIFLIAFSFNYYIYTFTGKDVSFILDLFVALILFINPYIRLFSFLLLLIAFIGRYILDYPAPWF